MPDGKSIIFKQDPGRRGRVPSPKIRAMPSPPAEFTLALPAGYSAQGTLRFLGRDAESLCERVTARGFSKAVRLAGRPALLAVQVGARRARCRISAPSNGRRSRPFAPAEVDAARLVVRRLLGLAGGDPADFERHARRVGQGRLVAGRPGLRIPLSAEPFEGLVWAILGQQVNVAFAATLRRRLIALCGEPLSIGGEGSRAWAGSAAAEPFLHPPPEAVAALDPGDLLPLQLSRGKAGYLVGAARAVAAGDLPLDRLAGEPPEEVEARLLALRGVGPWTAQYVMLRALGLPDCAPVGDAGLAAALTRFYALDHRPGPEETRALLEPFRPYRSLATAHLWASLADAPSASMPGDDPE